MYRRKDDRDNSFSAEESTILLKGKDDGDLFLCTADDTVGGGVGGGGDVEHFAALLLEVKKMTEAIIGPGISYCLLLLCICIFFVSFSLSQLHNSARFYMHTRFTFGPF